MGIVMRTEDDWQQQSDEVVALASILDTDFTLTAGPEVSGDIEQDISALVLASPCSEQLQCTAAVRVALPAGELTIMVRLYFLFAMHSLTCGFQTYAASWLHSLSTWLLCAHSTRIFQ